MLYGKIFSIIENKFYPQVLFLLFLNIIVAASELISISAFYPFISLLTNPSSINEGLLKSVYDFSSVFGITTRQDFLLFLGALILILILLSLAFKITLSYYSTKFVMLQEHYISLSLANQYLHKSFSWIFTKNSSDLGKNILSEVSIVISGALLPLITIISQTILVLILIIFLIIIDPLVAFFGTVVFGFSYLGFFFLTKNYLFKMGVLRTNSNKMRYVFISEAFGSFKQIKINGLEKFFIRKFEKYSESYVKSQTMAKVIAVIPRQLIESITYITVIVYILFSVATGNEGFLDFIPILTLYALSGLRILPAVQQIYNSAVQIKHTQPSTDLLLSDLVDLDSGCKSNSIEIQELSFNRSIVLDNISFAYRSSHNVINNLSFQIPINSMVGLVGPSGCGKTTLVDLISGLLQPSSGNVWIDKKRLDESTRSSWQKNIGYVTQDVFLVDATVKENIAFGVTHSEIDIEKVESVAKDSEIHEFIINDLEHGYDTVIGERGIRMSGGQRQRLGIARALYRNPKLLIMDEATSALDMDTEKKIMQSIAHLREDITIIIITHRKEAVKDCHTIYMLQEGTIARSGAFHELYSEK